MKVGWQTARTLLENNAAKVVSAIPLFGYLIIFNDALVSSFGFDSIVGVEAGEPSPLILSSSIKLKLAFFGSLAVAVALLLFRTLAPHSVRVAQTDFEYASYVNRNYSFEELLALEEAVWSGNEFFYFRYDGEMQMPVDLSDDDRLLPNHVSEEDGYRYTLARRQVSHPDSIKDRRGYVQTLARVTWYRDTRSQPGLSWTIVSLAAWGYLLLSISSLEIIQAVIRQSFTF